MAESSAKSGPSAAILNRLREIAAVAVGARQEAAARLSNYGMPLERTTDITLVAGVLTGGLVERCPNLTDDGQRVAGLLVGEGRSPSLYCEQYDLDVRQRFSVGHELGHFFLHPRSSNAPSTHCTPGRVDAGETVREEGVLDTEDEADAFAAAFLMPADDISADIIEFGRCIAFLAERYQVSEPAMRRRLKTMEWLNADENRASL